MAWVMVILNPCNEERASLAYEGRERERERGGGARGPLFNTYAGNKRNGGELQKHFLYIYLHFRLVLHKGYVATSRNQSDLSEPWESVMEKGDVITMK